MFDTLSESLERIFTKLRGETRLTRENIQEALEEMKKALLTADVGYSVANEFIEKVGEKAIGNRVLKSLTPAQQVVQIVYEELTSLMGETSDSVNLAGKPPVAIMLVGLQGSGKTTTAAKLARYLKKKKRSPYLVPADVTRPAAIEQLKTLAAEQNLDVYDTQPGSSPVEVAKKALEIARKFGLDTLILDTAGRLHIDDALMAELKEIKSAINPVEILLVTDAMTGQDAVNIAKKFKERIGITGCILTKLDGDARGGAALSIRAVANAPIKLVGVGEKVADLEPFHPDRMASRILDKGDILSLVEKAKDAIDIDEAKKLHKKIKKKQFTLSDFREQLRQMKRLGSLEDTLKMVPGMGKAIRQVKDLTPAEEEFRRMAAIIDSMTPQEREDYKVLDGSRRRRIASGSGTDVQDVNRLIKQFQQVQKMMHRLGDRGIKNILRGFGGF
ncbi:MAG: signal recognition particle protein [Myxococcota bacterium]